MVPKTSGAQGYVKIKADVASVKKIADVITIAIGKCEITVTIIPFSI